MSVYAKAINDITVEISIIQSNFTISGKEFAGKIKREREREIANPFIVVWRIPTHIHSPRNTFLGSTKPISLIVGIKGKKWISRLYYTKPLDKYLCLTISRI